MSSARILIVEDEVIISMEIQERIKVLGYEVVGTADTMDRAIEQAKAKMPDLCLMDIMLKGTGTGIDAAKIIYGELSIPIIFMTAYSDDDTLQRAKKVSPFGYILKPIDKNAMRISLEIALYKHTMDSKLAASESKFRRLFENAKLGLFICNSDGRIVDANKSLCDYWGLEQEKLPFKKYIWDYFNTTDSKFHDLIDLAKETGKSQKSVIQTFTNSGSLKYANISVNIVKDPKDDSFLIEGFVDDITDRITHEKLLVKAKDDAEKAAHMKDEFLAGMSHEIRSPVHTILSYVSLLAEEFKSNTNSELEQIFRSINLGGDRLIRTIDMILNMSDLNSGSFELIKSEINMVNDLLKPLTLEFREQARNKNLELNLIIKAENVKIASDSYSITQIFANLLDNSLKYTSVGKIDVLLENPTENLLSVKIIDTGKGIAEDYLPNIFSTFSQEETGYRRKFDGTGLGMALVKRYCDLVKAEIDIVSKKNNGTTIKVTFKLD